MFIKFNVKFIIINLQQKEQKNYLHSTFIKI